MLGAPLDFVVLAGSPLDQLLNLGVVPWMHGAVLLLTATTDYSVRLLDFDRAIDPAATANNDVMIYGDVRAGFLIVDRIRTTWSLPSPTGATARPS